MQVSSFGSCSSSAQSTLAHPWLRLDSAGPALPSGEGVDLSGGRVKGAGLDGFRTSRLCLPVETPSKACAH